MSTTIDAPLRGALSELCGEGFVRAIEQTFGDLEIAEEEVAAAKKRHPFETDLIDACFLDLQRSVFLLEKADFVYRSHVRELCERAASSGDLTDATDAEIVCCLMGASMLAPLNHDGFLLYYTCFCRAFPEYTNKVFDHMDYQPRESYPGRLNELLSSVARKIQRRIGKQRAPLHATPTEERKEVEHVSPLPPAIPQQAAAPLMEQLQQLGLFE
jgi:hypothetical protein